MASCRSTEKTSVERTFWSSGRRASPAFGRRIAESVSIVISQLHDQNLIASFLVNDPVLRSDTSRPKALERMPERLRFPDPDGRIPRDLFNKKVDPQNHPRISLLPVKIIVPSLRRENEIHWPSLILRLIPLPRFKVSTAASSRFAFAGERSR